MPKLRLPTKLFKKNYTKSNIEHFPETLTVGTGGKTNYRILPNLRIAYAMPIALFAAGIGTYMVFFSSAAPTDTANLWIDSNGGSCQRSSSQITYSTGDATSCSSMQLAAAASQCSTVNNTPVCDTVRMVAGSYGNQSVSASKAYPGVKIIAESGTVVGGLSLSGSWVEVQNVKSTSYSSFGGSRNTWRNVEITGLDSWVTFGGSDNSWIGGSLHDLLKSYGSAIDEPIDIFGATNALIDGVEFYNISYTPHPEVPKNPHLEIIRIDRGSTNTTIQNSYFHDNNENTATIFFTQTPGTSAPSGLTLLNNRLDDNPEGATNLDMSKLIPCTTVLIAYNTFKGGTNGVACTSPSNVRWIGNLGSHAMFNCIGTFSYNVWQADQGSCGATDTRVNGPTYQTGALGLGGTDGFRLLAGSPAIDKSETPGASTTCSPTGVGGLRTDAFGGSRPFGTKCDAGAHEYGSAPAGGGGSQTNSNCPDQAAGKCRPYDDQSPWNTEIANYMSPSIDPDSSKFMQAIKNNGIQLTSKFTEYTPTIIPVNNSTPKVPVVLLEGNYGWGNGYIYDQGDNKVDKTSTTPGKPSAYQSPQIINNVPIPSNFVASQIPGSDDAQVVFWNTDTGEEWAFWQFRPTSTTNGSIDGNTQSPNYTTTSAKWASTNLTKYHTKTDANGNRYFGRNCGQDDEVNKCAVPSTMGRGGRGAGTPYFAGLIRQWEVESGTINHALSFAYNYPCNQFRYPAAKSDGTNNCAATTIGGAAALHPPEGTRLQLDPSLTDAQLAAAPYSLNTPAKLAVAHAMQKYGLYIIDNSGRPKLNLEYSTNPNWSDAAPLGEYSFQGIPWTAFRVVSEPCDPTGTGCSAPPDTTPPNTSISTSTPVNGTSTTSTTASITFSGTDNIAVTSYECSLDSTTTYSACTSPKAYGTPTALTTGSHTFRVRAKDAAGNTDATPASITWTITGTTTTKPGDLNNDNSVNTTDLVILLSKFGTADPNANLNSQGNVDTTDLIILLSKFGS